jgi:flagellar hook-associated protein 2
LGARRRRGAVNLTTNGGGANRHSDDDRKSVTAQQSKLSDDATQLTKQYQSQFTALNTLMATMNNNSAYLTALFGGSKSAGALATNK